MTASPSIAEIVKVLRRWRWVIILTPLCFLLVTTILVCYVIPPMYEASTTLLVGRNVISNQTAALRYEDLLLSQQLVSTYGEIARSWTVSEDVIRELSLPLTVEQFTKKISVTQVSGTQVIRLSVYDRDPTLAAQIANTTAGVFVERVPELLQLNNVAILDQARVPITPAKPQKALILTVTFATSLMAVLLLVLAIEYLDGRIRSRDQAEKALGLPVLGSIPRRRSTLNDGSAPTYLALLDEPHSPVSEAYRSLRTNLQSLSTQKGMRVIAVTSARPMEGKTTVAANMAIGVAQTGKRVILVDADLRRPTLHKVMGSSNDVGLSNLLAGNAEDPDQLLISSKTPGLRLLPSGPAPDNPAELLGGQRFNDVLTYLGSICDLVIVDTPPIGAVTDGAVIGSQADGVVLVASNTQQDAVVGAQSALRQANAEILGLILNQVTQEMDRYYDYYTSE